MRDRAHGKVIVLDALAARFGGTAYAALQVAAALGRREDVARVLLIAQRGSIVGRAGAPGPGVVAVTLDAPASRLELVWRIGWEALRMPALAAAARADGLVSFSGMVPRRPGCPVICVLANPVPYAAGAGSGDRVRRAAIARTRRHAIASYVPSSAMRERVGDPPARVVPLGVDRKAFPPLATPGADLLCVADFYAHKRHDLILAAWALLPEPRPSLRLIGNPAVDPETFAHVRAMADDPRISVEAQVPFTRLLEAYQNARALLVASEHESFSMPLAEAVAAGIPAVIRDDPVLRETGGPGALAVPEPTAAAWASVLRQVLEDDALHARLSRDGRAYGARYSWDAMAEAVVTDLGG